MSKYEIIKIKTEIYSKDKLLTKKLYFLHNLYAF